jgi:hypothetical protein
VFTNSHASARSLLPLFQLLKASIAGALLTLAAATAASAATITVDGTACTLAAAITAANTDAPAGGCVAGAGADVIRLSADVLVMAMDNVDAAGCATGLPVITSTIRIIGNRHTIARADGAPEFRVIDSRPGTLALEDVTVRNGRSGTGCTGAGINGGVLSLTRSTVSNNHGGGYGSIEKIEGAGIAATSLTLTRSTVADNEGQGIGVVGSAFLSHSTVTRNRWGYFTFTAGGGMAVLGTATIEDSTISDNAALEQAGVGGGLYVDGGVTLTNSTISGNFAAGVYGLGGGLFLYRGAATLIDSTVSGNRADSCQACWGEGGSGGGIFAAGAGMNRGPDAVVALVHSTVAENRAAGPFDLMTPDGGFGGGVAGYVLRMTNSIVAKNVAANGALADCSATDVQFTGMSLVGDGSCGAASSGQLTGDPLLGPLSDYGGATQVHLLLPGSPAIGKIAFTEGVGCAGTTVVADQRGVARRQFLEDDTCDIGAVEDSGFPANAVLDNFNRADGSLGANWTGAKTGPSYRLAIGQIDVGNGGPIYWAPATFGLDQEAYVTIAKVDATGVEHGVLLKVQGDPGDYTQGEIEVFYEPMAHAVRVATLLPGTSAWTIYPRIPVTFQDEDQLGGRVLANGTVQLYRNSVLLATVTLKSKDQKFFNQRGGRIGLWFDGSSKAVFDSFGGGTVAR